jgi:hypothetical protein
VPERRNKFSDAYLLGLRLLDSIVWVRSGAFISLQETEPRLFETSVA